MAAAVLQPKLENDPDAAGQFLTFVLPAPSGCNLKCSFCLVRRRQETTDTLPRPEDYARAGQVASSKNKGGRPRKSDRQVCAEKGGQWCRPSAHKEGAMWLPPTRDPDFWVRVLRVLKAIIELCRVVRSK